MHLNQAGWPCSGKHIGLLIDPKCHQWQDSASWKFSTEFMPAYNMWEFNPPWTLRRVYQDELDSFNQ